MKIYCVYCDHLHKASIEKRTARCDIHEREMSLETAWHSRECPHWQYNPVDVFKRGGDLDG